MGRQFIKYSFLTIGAYLAVAHASDLGHLLLDTSSAASGYASTLQGRGGKK